MKQCIILYDRPPWKFISRTIEDSKHKSSVEKQCIILYDRPLWKFLSRSIEDSKHKSSVETVLMEVSKSQRYDQWKILSANPALSTTNPLWIVRSDLKSHLKSRNALMLRRSDLKCDLKECPHPSEIGFLKSRMPSSFGDRIWKVIWNRECPPSEIGFLKSRMPSSFGDRIWNPEWQIN